jgi:NifB/MoaA-like Fe-S oxidoreductase
MTSSDRGRQPDGEDVIYRSSDRKASTSASSSSPPQCGAAQNRCEFCFIEGLPKGLRKNLYIRDDDYRLSFAYGNFATLSNMKERDEQRINRVSLVTAHVSCSRDAMGRAKVLLNIPRFPTSSSS